MASDVFKFLHSRRIMKTNGAINRQFKIAKTYGVDVDDDQSHRFAKKHALNCGQKNCIFCANPRRLFGEKTFQEKSMEQRRLQEEYDYDYEDYLDSYEK